MKEYLNIKKSTLFLGIKTQDLLNMLECLLINIKTYEKISYIFTVSQSLIEVGIILKGRVNIIQEDYWDNRNILTILTAGDLFGKTIAWFSIMTTELSNSYFFFIFALTSIYFNV